MLYDFIETYACQSQDISFSTNVVSAGSVLVNYDKVLESALTKTYMKIHASTIES